MESIHIVSRCNADRNVVITAGKLRILLRESPMHRFGGSIN